MVFMTHILPSSYKVLTRAVELEAETELESVELAFFGEQESVSSNAGVGIGVGKFPTTRCLCDLLC